MEYFAVSSSNIQSVGYDPETMTLAVIFVNGTEYQYYGVPPDVFEQEGAVGSPSSPEPRFRVVSNSVAHGPPHPVGDARGAVGVHAQG